MEQESVFETRKSLKGTLRKLTPGVPFVIRNKDFKASQVRSTASEMKRREKLVFTVSDAGRIDDVVVTRLK